MAQQMQAVGFRRFTHSKNTGSLPAEVSPIYALPDPAQGVGAQKDARFAPPPGSVTIRRIRVRRLNSATSLLPAEAQSLSDVVKKQGAPAKLKKKPRTAAKKKPTRRKLGSRSRAEQIIAAEVERQAQEMRAEMEREFEDRMDQIAKMDIPFAAKQGFMTKLILMFMTFFLVVPETSSHSARHPECKPEPVA